MTTRQFQITITSGHNSLARAKITRYDSYTGDKETFPDGVSHRREITIEDTQEAEELLDFLGAYCPEAWGLPLDFKMTET